MCILLLLLLLTPTVRNNFILVVCCVCNKQQRCGCLGHYRRVRRWWRGCRSWWRCRMWLHRCERCHVKWWRWQLVTLFITYDLGKIKAMKLWQWGYSSTVFHNGNILWLAFHVSWLLYFCLLGLHPVADADAYRRQRAKQYWPIRRASSKGQQFGVCYFHCIQWTNNGHNSILIIEMDIKLSNKLISQHFSWFKILITNEIINRWGLQLNLFICLVTGWDNWGNDGRCIWKHGRPGWVGRRGGDGGGKGSVGANSRCAPLSYLVHPCIKQHVLRWWLGARVPNAKNARNAEPA